MFETLKVMTNLCSQLNSKRGISATAEEQAGESRRHLSGSIWGGDILWPVFKKTTLLQQRHGALQAEEGEELKGTALRAHIHFIFPRKQLRASRSSQGTKGCGDGAGRGPSKTSSARTGRGRGLHIRQPKDGLSRQHPHRINCQQWWRKS